MVHEDLLAEEMVIDREDRAEHMATEFRRILV